MGDTKRGWGKSPFLCSKVSDLMVDGIMERITAFAIVKTCETKRALVKQLIVLSK
jgi:hypothetical protein